MKGQRRGRAGKTKGETVNDERSDRMNDEPARLSRPLTSPNPFPTPSPLHHLSPRYAGPSGVGERVEWVVGGWECRVRNDMTSELYPRSLLGP